VQRRAVPLDTAPPTSQASGASLIAALGPLRGLLCALEQRSVG
jgi:hypothetical protein